MTTQYTSILKLALPVQGELSGTWGDVVNDNITSMVEEAVAGRAVINTWTTNSHTLTTADGTTSESRCAMLEFTDTGAALTGAATVVCPSASKLYVCKNGSGQQVTIQTAAGTGVAIPDGQTMFVFCDGTNVEQCTTNFNSLSFNDFTLNFGGAVTTAGAFTTSGAYALTLTTTGATNVTLPTTGTLATLDGTETLTNKTLTGPTISSPTLTGSISATDLTISGNTTIGDASTDTLTVNSTITSNLIFTDDTYDIGAVGATRPRNLYLSGDATIGGTVTLSGGIDVTGALGVDGNFDVNTDKFTVASATGNTVVAGTLGVTGVTTATGGLNVDTISEITAAGGVTVDGVLLKDGGATLTGDLTVDTDTLYVDSTNDRVGVNEATPLEALHVTTSDSGTTISKTVGSTSGPVFVLDNTDDTTNNLAAIQFASSGSSSTDVVATTGIYSINTGRGGTYSYGDLAVYTTNSGGTHTEAMRIDSSQRVLIGTTSSVDTAGIEARIQLVGTNSSTSSSTFTRFSANNGAPSVRLGKSRSGSPTSNTIVQDGDYLGTVNFVADDGTDLYSTAAFISGQVDGTPGVDDMPGRLAFFTTPDGANSATERMRINNAGDVTIGNAADARAKLEVYDSSVSAVFNATDLSTWRVMQVRNNIESATGTAAGIAFGGDGSGDTETAGIVGISDNSTGGIVQLAFLTAAGNNSIEAMRIDSSQRVLMGAGTDATSTITNGWWNGSTLYTGILNIQNVNDGSAQKYVSLAVSRHSNDAEAGQLGFAKSRGSTANSKTTVGNGDTLGLVTFQGADGSNLVEAARISGATDGTAANDDMPGRLMFYTTADGASAPTERMRITSSGVVAIRETTPWTDVPLNVAGYSSENALGAPSPSTETIDGARISLYAGNRDHQLYMGSQGWGMCGNTESDFTYKSSTNADNGDVVMSIRWGATGTGRVRFGGNSDASGDSAQATPLVYVDGTTGTRCALMAKAGGDDNVATIISTNASYAAGGGGVLYVGCRRAASSAYSFAGWYSTSNGALDREFNFRGDGNAFADGSFSGGGADYAEYFEWADGNPSSEDRRGMSVVLVNEKIRVATATDPTSSIIGVVSAMPAVVGDTAWNHWSEQFLRDDFGAYQWEAYTLTEWEETISYQDTDADGNPLTKTKKEKQAYETDRIPSDVTPPADAQIVSVDDNGNTLMRRVLNPDYDPTRTYVPREERPEWDAVGMVGKLRIRVGQPTGDRWIKLKDISSNVEEWLVR